MTTIEIEQKISDAFCGGEITRRELRLSAEEVRHLQDKGTVLLSRLAGDETEEPSPCLWFDVEFKGAMVQ